MDTYGKLSSSDPEGKCNIISPFYPNYISPGLNPITNTHIYREDIDKIKSTILNINNEYNGVISLCCDPNDPFKNQEVLKRYRDVFPSVRLIKKNGILESIYCSYVKKPASGGWTELTPHIVCKLSGISSSNIKETDDKDVVHIINLKKDCFTDNCDNIEGITLEHIFEKKKSDMVYTYYDDAKVVDSIKHGSTDGVEDYLYKYNKVNQVLTHDDFNRRIIHIASIYYNEEVFNMILSVKPDLNKRDALDNTPLHYACIYGHIDLVNTLIKLGAEPNMKNKEGQTPIMLGSIFKGENDTLLNNVKIVRLMYNKGVSILDSDNKGNNLLHYVLRDSPNHQEKSILIKYLIERGIDIEKENDAGETPLLYIYNRLKELNTNVPEGEYNIEGFGVNERVMRDFTDEERELLVSQTLIFNSILRRNPNKYSGYINVSMVPKGAPIEILEYNCVGHEGITGIEDEAECIKQGGNFVKINEMTTKVKLELLPDSEVAIDAVNEEELYYTKNPEPVILKPLPNTNFNNKPSNNNNNNKVKGNAGNTKPSNNNNKVKVKGNAGNNDDLVESYISRSEYPQINNISTNGKIKSRDNFTDNTNQQDSNNVLLETTHPDRKSNLIMTAEIENAMNNSNKYMDSIGSNIDKKTKTNKILLFLKQNIVLILVLVLLLFIFIISVIFTNN